MPTLRVEVGESLGGERLDRAVALLTGIDRARAQALVAGGDVRLDGLVERRRARRLRPGEVLELAWNDPSQPRTPQAEPTVLFEDEDVIVVAKPAGLVTHRVHERDERPSVADWAQARWPELRLLDGEPLRRGLVHRLDVGTSGAMVLARTSRALEVLRVAVRAHEVERRYLALVAGAPPQRARIEAPIGRDLRDPARMAIVEGGRAAATELETRWVGPDTALVELVLETGRTHQIRVHLAAIGHPVVGDRRYGVATPDLARPFLHAWRVAFEHPTRGGRVVCEAPVPAELEAFARRAATSPVCGAGASA